MTTPNLPLLRFAAASIVARGYARGPLWGAATVVVLSLFSSDEVFLYAVAFVPVLLAAAFVTWVVTLRAGLRRLATVPDDELGSLVLRLSALNPAQRDLALLAPLPRYTGSCADGHIAGCPHRRRGF